jgi:peptide deformylase
MIRPIVHDPLFLRQLSKPADVKRDASVAKDLIDTLRAHRDSCVGMAANMIGVPKRIIIADTGLLPLVMFNPVLLSGSEPYETQEGCLSLPGERKTKRYRKITVSWIAMNGQKQKAVFSDRTAQILQHEMDHLDGILI